MAGEGVSNFMIAEFWDPSFEWLEEDYFCDAASPTP
jgi:hypothetical protein